MHLLLLLVLSVQDPGSVPAPPVPVLLEREGPRAREAGAGPTTVRGRGIEVDRAALRSAERIRLDLFDGQAVVATRTRRTATRPGGFTWLGSVGSDPRDLVAFAVQDEGVAGTIRIGGRLYRVLGSPAGGLVLTEDDPSLEPPCGTTAAHVLEREGDALAPLPPATDAPGDTVIDVGVVWTPEARVGAGGTSAIRALVDLAVLETNVAYDQSLVPLDLRLVFAREVSYVESPDFSLDLDRLRLKNDGHMDEVHVWRDNFGADDVSLFVNGTQYCGVGYLMSTPSTAFEDRAFNVVARACATGNFSFGHELGHNYGSAHDRANWTGGSPSHSFSYGHRTSNGTWRTIMAIFQGQRIQYFSNPDVSYQGFPLGVPESEPDSAHNALSFELNAPFVSAWRPTVGMASVYGSGINPDRSIGLLNEQVAIGRTSVVGLDNPLGTQGPGTVAFLALSLAPAPGYPAGILLPGFGMTAPGSAGELLIALGSSRIGSLIPGSPWGGPGSPSQVQVPFPNDPAFVGSTVYAQGLLVDPAVTFGIRYGLTDALALFLGEL